MRGSSQPWLVFVGVAFLPWTRCETTVLVEPAATNVLHVTGNTDVFQAVWNGRRVGRTLLSKITPAAPPAGVAIILGGGLEEEAYPNWCLKPNMSINCDEVVKGTQVSCLGC